MLRFADGDPNNYLTYYKRGTVYLALGKAKLALLDLDKVMELKPDFTAAKLQRGNVLLKQGEFDDAALVASSVVRSRRTVKVQRLCNTSFGGRDCNSVFSWTLACTVKNKSHWSLRQNALQMRLFFSCTREKL